MITAELRTALAGMRQAEKARQRGLWADLESRDERSLRSALAWLSGYDPQAFAAAMEATARYARACRQGAGQ